MTTITSVSTAAPGLNTAPHSSLRTPQLSARWHLLLGLVLPVAVLVINMLRVRGYTVDDAYISYRYARNFARGLGLVYNPGERIEGYTNFLWTVLLGIGFPLGLDPDLVAKLLGAGASCASLLVVYKLSRRLQPYAAIPCIATWLMATSIVQTGYAVFGLETSFFTALVLWGTLLVFRERDAGRGVPYSALVFALAALTRPEAPLFLGILMLFLGRRVLERQNLIRGLLFLAPVLVHLMWRHTYYGEWLPNTLTAKTGNLAEQLARGQQYLAAYAWHTWPVLLAGLGGLWIATGSLRRSRWASVSGGQQSADARCFAAVMLAGAAYITLVGGDWMPYFRFLAPFEPFWFLLACSGVRSALDYGVRFVWPAQPRSRLTLGVALAVMLLVAGAVAFRVQRLVSAQGVFDGEKAFWDSSAGEVANWLIVDGTPGLIAVADIGYIGYATDYPLLDLLGLVDPVISKLPGGYTRKTGPGYVERAFAQVPQYFVLVGNGEGCHELPFPAQEKLRVDPRFQRSYEIAALIRHSKGRYWCVFERRTVGR